MHKRFWVKISEGMGTGETCRSLGVSDTQIRDLLLTDMMPDKIRLAETKR